MADVVKSIFRQREVEKLYRLKLSEYYSSGYITYSSRSVAFEGNEKRILSDKEIGRYDIEIPMLEVGDEFFLHDIQEVVVIKSKMRSSDGSVTYYVEDKIIETENTKESYEECNKIVGEYDNQEKEILKLKEKFEDYKREYKYKNRFFNKKTDD
jgi:hypothetical protein